MIETLVYGYSSESTQRELSTEYQHDRIKCFSKIFEFLTKVASALEGLIEPTLIGYRAREGGGGALGFLGGRIRSLSKLKNTPKALIFGQKAPLF